MQQMHSKSFMYHEAWLRYIRTPKFTVSLPFCIAGGLQPLRPVGGILSLSPIWSSFLTGVRQPHKTSTTLLSAPPNRLWAQLNQGQLSLKYPGCIHRWQHFQCQVMSSSHLRSWAASAGSQRLPSNANERHPLSPPAIARHGSSRSKWYTERQHFQKRSEWVIWTLIGIHVKRSSVIWLQPSAGWHVLVVCKRRLSVDGFMVSHLWSQVAFMVLLFKVWWWEHVVVNDKCYLPPSKNVGTAKGNLKLEASERKTRLVQELDPCSPRVLTEPL